MLGRVAVVGVIVVVWGSGVVVGVHIYLVRPQRIWIWARATLEALCRHGRREGRACAPPRRTALAVVAFQPAFVLILAHMGKPLGVTGMFQPLYIAHDFGKGFVLGFLRERVVVLCEKLT